MFDRTFDVIVVGGGHAGAEAAAAAARMGASTALITHEAAKIGEMSCNPAIGGLGKGHLVREIDALDGLMGRVADQAGIQFRLLNRSKGPAVQGPRTQADRKLYRQAMQAAIQATPGLEVIEGGVEDILVEGGEVVGLSTACGRRFGAGAVVLTTGTFLNGLIHMGETKIPAGPGGRCPGAQAFRAALRAGPAHGAAQDRHAGAPRRPQHRLGEPRHAGGGRRSGAVLVPDRQDHDAADFLRDHAHDRGDARHHPGQPRPVGHVFGPDREPGAALLPVHRGQGGAVRRSRLAPGVPGARGPRRRHGLSQRRLDLAAGGCAGGVPAHAAGSRAGGDQAAGLCHRIRLRGSARAQADAGNQGSAAPFPGRADQRHHGIRGGGRPGHRRRHQCGAQGRGRRSASSWFRGRTAISAS